MGLHRSRNRAVREAFGQPKRILVEPIARLRAFPPGHPSPEPLISGVGLGVGDLRGEGLFLVLPGGAKGLVQRLIVLNSPPERRTIRFRLFAEKRLDVLDCPRRLWVRYLSNRRSSSWEAAFRFSFVMSFTPSSQGRAKLPVPADTPR
jgi:hypothetical protein